MAKSSLSCNKLELAFQENFEAFSIHQCFPTVIVSPFLFLWMFCGGFHCGFVSCCLHLFIKAPCIFYGIDIDINNANMVCVYMNTEA